jgi:GNAT superfamily N-acetyltransferase
MNTPILSERLPSVEEFQYLRKAVGWGEVDAEAIGLSLRNSLYGVCIHHDTTIIGSGRVIGDGGLCFYIQDIMVHPDYQKQGHGTAIMERIMVYVRKHMYRGGFVGLMAAKGVEDFYVRYGFMKRPTQDVGPGMILFWQ